MPETYWQTNPSKLMSPETANDVPPAFAIGSAFDAPLPPESSDALSTLVAGVELRITDGSLEAAMSNRRLGIASGLFRALKLKHPPTAKHCLRVALGCSVFATRLGLDDRTREQIEIAALLHDVGKLGVPDQILNKPGRLNENEYEIVEQHALFGIHILESFCTDQSILDIIRYSSTWFDGTRPVGSKFAGEQLPIGSRIIAIQNAFDAMTTDMVYRKALPRERAIAELFENAPSQFDPKLVNEFFNTHQTEAAQLQSQIVRRWTEMSTEFANDMWSFSGSVVQENTNVQSIFQQQLLESMQDGVVFVDTSARIMVWNRGAQALTGLSKESVHHKIWSPKIVDLRDMEGNAIKSKGCPLLACFRTMDKNESRFTVSNRERNTRVAVHAQSMPVSDASGVCHGAILTLHDVSPEQSLEQTVENLQNRVTIDALTGVANRAEFDRRIKELLEFHIQDETPLGLVICDIDRFKSINDTYGHQAGDAALIEFAQLISQLSRGDDLVARYGGEEFVLLCPGCTTEIAKRKAEEIRKQLARTPQPALNNTKMTASFGVTASRASDTPETMLKRADTGLYEAKEGGRNRVVAVGEERKNGQAEPSITTSWFQWGGWKEPAQTFLHKWLRCSVPIEVIEQKFSGFISDQQAEIVSTDKKSTVLRFDESSKSDARSKSQRPIDFTMNVKIRADEERGFGGVIEVEITGSPGRDRRLEHIHERADNLFQQLKEYLIADETTSFPDE